MSLGWASDFSYEYFRRILQTIKSNFELHLISETPQILDTIGQPKLILRHDVDVSLKRAIRMAEIENDFGIRATYMVMTNSPLYRVGDLTSQDTLLKLIDMGHEVGLHFDIENDAHVNNRQISSVEAMIHTDCAQLENIVGLHIRSISFHRPQKLFVRGPSMLSGRVNANSKELMEWYLSDSKGCWKEGEPLPKLLGPDKPLLQLLIHPIWWGDEHMLPEDRLQAFFDAETRRQPWESADALDAALAKMIPAVRRRGSQIG
jgi:hypothetical protein